MSEKNNNMIISTDEINVPGNWYRVDFHVHSPGSSDFALPFKDDQSFISLLEDFKEARLDVVVITDHNDIKGYQRFIELKTDLERTARTLSRTNIEIPIDLKKQIDLFNQVIILPGAEIDVDPNVHILVLFDPSTELSVMNEFIEKAGYPEDKRGDESASRYAKWNTETLCNEAIIINSIAIAAHVDSDKGLYEVSKKWGQKRIAAFTEKNLSAMEFINPIARDQIENLLKLPDYERESKLAFVQSSDYHRRDGEKLGERLTWVRMDNDKNYKWEASEVFKSLKVALRNPDEYISAPGRPEIRQIQNRLSQAPAVEGLDSDALVDRFLKYSCAITNTEDGTLVIGKNDKGNWVGIDGVTPKEINEKIKELIFGNLDPIPHVEVQVYRYYSSRYFATVRINKLDQICAIKNEDRVYLLKNGLPKLLTIREVVEQAENRFLDRYSSLSISSRVSGLAKRLSVLRDGLDILPLVRKIEANTKPFLQVFPRPKLGTFTSPELQKAIEYEYNGYTEGSVVCLSPTPPRLKDQYIRASAPLGKCDFTIAEFSGIQQFIGEKIIVVAKGAIYYDDGPRVVTCEEIPPLIIQASDDYDGPVMKVIAAYLKSSIPIWYAGRYLKSLNLRDYNVLSRMPVPYSKTFDRNGTLGDLFDKLLVLEKSYLQQEREEFNLENEKGNELFSPEFGKKRIEIVHNHNKAAAQILIDIDSELCELLGLTVDEIKIIRRELETYGISALETEC